jgi:hypothetical protein
MTKEELQEKIKKNLDKISQIKKDIEDDRKQFADELTAKYAEYLGKKVSITWLGWRGKTQTINGYFWGFSSGSSTFGLAVYMKVNKCKQDGSMSKCTYSGFDLPTIDDTFDIEIIE